MSGESWLIAISVGIIAIAFVVLVVFTIMALISLRKTLNSTNAVCKDLEDKIHAFDPYVRMVSGVGQTIEKGKETFEREIATKMHAQSHKVDNVVNVTLEVAEWALIGLALWQKIKERR